MRSLSSSAVPDSTILPPTSAAARVAIARACVVFCSTSSTGVRADTWRSAVNTEAKLLLLAHAFEDLGMGRVTWKTDHLNERSQNAIRRLGAQYEGTFRRHRRRPDGTWRDTLWFSMLSDEWPAARARLTERLAAG